MYIIFQKIDGLSIVSITVHVPHILRQNHPNMTDIIDTTDSNLFINHWCMAYWHVEKNTAEGLNPNTLSVGSGKKAWFTCPKCDHTFQKAIRDMPSDSTKNFCPFCAPSSARLCDNTDPNQGGCMKCFARTFAACEKASEWSINNDKPAHQHMRCGRGSALFICATCNHEYLALLNHACDPGGAPCPCCSARAKPNKIEVNKDMARTDAEAGLKTCDTCGEQHALGKFGKLTGENRRATCNTCRNTSREQAQKRRDQESIDKATTDGTIATKICSMCVHTKSILEFDSNRSICKPCRTRRDAENAHIKASTGNDTQIINGLFHRGDLPVHCRNCQNPFSLENAVEFRYHTDNCKYMDHCKKCHALHEKTSKNSAASREKRAQENPEQFHANNAATARAYRTNNPEVGVQAHVARNTIPESKLNHIRSSARTRSILFAEEDTEDMLVKITMPCYYCGITSDETGGRISGLDRVDNQQGYSALNTVPCCTVCNMMKGTLTLSEFKNQMMHCIIHMMPELVNTELVDKLPARINYTGQRKREIPEDTTTLIAPPPAKRTRKIHAPQGISVVFYNMDTNRIAHVVSSIKEAGAVVGIVPSYASNKIHQNVPWILPHWGARHASEHDEPPNAEENATMFAALAQRGNRPRLDRSYQLINDSTKEVIKFRDLNTMAAAINANLDELSRQFANEVKNGVKRVKINDVFSAEAVDGECKNV
jgi:hypothetical protein